MKKFRNISLWGLVFFCIITILSSCSNDDEFGGSSSSLVGTWDCTSYIQYYRGDAEIMPTKDTYIEFTKEKMRFHDPEDVADNMWLEYSYDSSSGIIKVGGYPIWIVEQLTSSTLKVKTIEAMSSYSTLTFKKR